MKPTRVPYPANLKVRHPLHGHRYEERTQLDAVIRKNLSRAVKSSNEAKTEVIVKTEKIDVDAEVTFDSLIGIKAERSPIKKSKKRKAPRDEGDVDTDDLADKPHKAKRAKQVKLEENDLNLDWLAAI